MSDRLTAVRVERRTVLRAAGIVAVFAVVAVLGGLFWRSRVDVPDGVVVGHRWYPTAFDAGEQASFAATGWYVVIALAAGVVLGLAAAWLSRTSELVTLGAVAVGSLVAAWLMLVVGLHGAPPDPQTAAASAADGTHLGGTISRPGAAAFVTWPLAALIPLGAVYLLVPGRRVEDSAFDA